MGAIIFLFFFNKTSDVSASRASCKTKDKYLGSLPLKLANMPKAVSSTAPPHFLLIIHKCYKGFGSTQSSVGAQSCLASYFLIPLPLQWIHAGHFPWTDTLGTSFQRQREQQRAKTRRGVRRGASLTTPPSCRHILYLPSYPDFNLLLCAISEKSQKIRKMFPNHVEVRNLEWARWKKSFSDLLWTVGQIRVCKR